LRPVSEDPVKETFWKSGWDVIQGPRSSPPADHIQNAGRKNVTNVVGGSKYRKRGKDRRLQDNSVAGQQRWERFCE